MTSMVPVARRNLLAEKGRLAMSVAGVAFAMLLVLIVVSLYRGWGEASRLFNDLPGELWVTQEGASDPFRSSSFVSADGASALVQIPGVQAVVPVYGRRIAFQKDAYDLDVFFMSLAVPDGLPVSDETRERFLPAPGGVVIDEVLAGEADLEAGDPIDLLGKTLVVERIEPGGNPLFELAWLNGDDAPELLSLPGYVTYFLLVTAPDADLAQVEDAASAAVPGSSVSTSAEFAESMSKLVDQGFLPVVGVLVAIGLVIGGAVIALTTYTATIEKARDYGVLKAVGASNRFVYRIVVEQSLIVGFLGAAIGVGASALAVAFIKRGVPEFVTDLRWMDALGLFAAAVAVSIAAAWLPARRINRIDPAMVFRA
jgi:putative ABC transport system permease protein